MEIKPNEDWTIKRGREKNEKHLEKHGAKWVDDGAEGEKRLSITPDQLEGLKKYGYAESAEINGHQLDIMAEPGTKPYARQYVIYAGGRIELNDDPDLAREVFKYAKALAKIEQNEGVLNEKVEDFAMERMDSK